MIFIRNFKPLPLIGAIKGQDRRDSLPRPYAMDNFRNNPN